MTTTSPIRVVVVDDHPLMRSALRALIDSVPDIAVVGEADDGAGARRKAQLAAADVVLMDLHMPDTNGVEATRDILAAMPQVRVLVLTMLEDDESVFAAMRAGAMGYLLKGSPQEEILHALRSVAQGQAVFGQALAHRVISYFASSSTLRPDPFPELTAREHEVLELIVSGLANPAIACRLVISPKTVSNHISAIFAKLQVADRVTAIARARDGGLAPSEGPQLGGR